MKREDIIRILGETTLCTPLGQAAFAAIEDVKKRIPIKVQEIHVDEYFCPACGAENTCNDAVVEDKYCPMCGQALDS